jgi:hypothetical protein
MYSLSRDADCGESERAATSAETPHVFTLSEGIVKTYGCEELEKDCAEGWCPESVKVVVEASLAAPYVSRYLITSSSDGSLFMIENYVDVCLGYEAGEENHASQYC